MTPPGDTVPSDWDGTSQCYYNPACGGTLVLNIFWNAQVNGNCPTNSTATVGGGNGYLPILSYNTTGNTAFANAKVAQFISGHGYNWNNTQGGNTFHGTSGYNYVQYCSRWSLVMSSSSIYLPLCIDNYFFLTTSYLNIGIVSVQTFGVVGSSWSGF